MNFTSKVNETLAFNRNHPHRPSAALDNLSHGFFSLSLYNQQTTKDIFKERRKNMKVC